MSSLSFDPKQYISPQPRPYPVVLLLDVSPSMAGEKIESLNASVRMMLDNFSKEECSDLRVPVAVITFGLNAEQYIPYTSSSMVAWQNLEADQEGGTRMGKAIKLAKLMIENRELTQGSGFRPLAILVSDGIPTDQWEDPMNKFIHEGRSSKCERMALAINCDVEGEKVLKMFVKGSHEELFTARNAGQITEFFEKVAMSVSTRIATQPTLKHNSKEEQSKENQNDDSSSSDKSEGYW